MSNSFIQEEYKISRNPFPPAASGIDIEKNLYIPPGWTESIEEYYAELSRGRGAKAFPVIGEYGTGKTMLLRGYLKEFFEGKRVKTFYFENPGAQFYDLANILMRNLGRYEFSKALWERCKEYLPKKRQISLFPKSFNEMLGELRNKKDRENKARDLQVALKDELRLTKDEEVAYKLGLMIAETASKPYFEYRDFVAGLRSSLVAERQEPDYFKAIIKAITETYNVEGVAFLIDEFEDVAIPKRMTRAKGYEYLATLRHLIDISAEENLWIIMAMTPQAAETTGEMNPALWDRFTHQKSTALKLEPLPREESKKLLIWWLNRARESDELKEYRDELYPFPEELLNLLDTSPELRSPRKLVRLGFFTLARAQQKKEEAPISLKFIKEIVSELYPEEIMGAKDDKD